MINRIESALNSMGQRRLLFIIGNHLSGKTKLVKEFLSKKYADDMESHYADVGLYMKNKVNAGYIETYEVYPEEFVEDADTFFKQLVHEKFGESNFVVFDHMEFLLSEKYTGWISILDRITLNYNTAIVVTPIEYKDSLPLRAYKYIEIE